MLEAERRIRTLVVDDEPLAREGLRLLLEGDAEIELCGEAGSGKAALAALRRLRPDLVFLDVQMPELSGFEVLAALPRESWPAVVFVTAYDRYALRAFEVHALDYLLKPFDDQRFADALARAKRHLRLARVEQIRPKVRAQHRAEGLAAVARVFSINPNHALGLATQGALQLIRVQAKPDLLARRSMAKAAAQALERALQHDPLLSHRFAPLLKSAGDGNDSASFVRGRKRWM